MTVTLNLEEIQDELRDIVIPKEQIQTGMKITQSGIIMVTADNQSEVSEYFKLQKGISGYPEFVTSKNSTDIGTIDEAKYGEEYYDEDNTSLLKIGIGIIIQKTASGKWDIYPNPSPYINDNPAKSYTNLEDINDALNSDEQIPSYKNKINDFGDIDINSFVDKEMVMAYKGGFGTANAIPSKMVRVDDILSNLMILKPDTLVRIVFGAEGQTVTMDGYLVIEEDTNEPNQFSHAINVEADGTPMGYDIEVSAMEFQRIAKLRSKILKETSTKIINIYDNQTQNSNISIDT